MAKIKTPRGTYRYTLVPLFEGVKVIDKNISRQNLEEFYDILASAGIRVYLAYGTMLGAAREHDFIDHDEDIDLGMSSEYQSALFSLLFTLREKGFEVCRYDRRGVISFMKQGEYIDIYIYAPESDGVVRCGREIMPKCFLTDLSEYEFLGKKYLAPRDYERYLNYWYGDNWMTPLKYYHYELPAWKRRLSIFLQYFKELLPDALFFALVEIQDKKYRAPFIKKIEQQYKKSE